MKSKKIFCIGIIFTCFVLCFSVTGCFETLLLVEDAVETSNAKKEKEKQIEREKQMKEAEEEAKKPKFVSLANSSVSEETKKEFKELFEQAKKYETEGKYVYALCTYYDVMALYPTISEDAFNRFKEISATIKKGNPGFGEFDEFAIRDGWISLRIEFEKYWSENNLYSFKSEKLVKGDVNYDKRTANYSIQVKVDFSEKYNYINTIFENGFSKVKRSDWNMEWGAGTIFTLKDGTPEAIYKKYGVAVVKIPSVKSPVVLGDVTSSLSDVEAAKLLFGNLSGVYYDVSLVKRAYWGYNIGSEVYLASQFAYIPLSFMLEYKDEYNINKAYSEYQKQKIAEKLLGLEMWRKSVEKQRNTQFLTMFDIKIYNTEGKEILKNRVTMNLDKNANITVSFENISAATMAIIDKGEYQTIIDNVRILYGSLGINERTKEFAPDNLKSIDLPVRDLKLTEQLIYGLKE